ncbi:hypothetical protein AWM68_03115 [Fictibacillus phosphorivorans]|uniref:NERD domain-containing protein n=1 Tax=Fictibacillus phosphorivorans TaxID=1221500 RepID=A0A163SJW8_9BACL|nr:nuclease-related domain-containing protein [Fictibacillus phosphorivorans]KZE69272.1 hypothetical protein AWM68_03115 [Fictibacillus phosphorivorans]
MKKQLNPPLFFQKLETLLRRLPNQHVKRATIENQLGKFRSGMMGEQSLNYFYRYLPNNEIIFLHNIRILHMDYYFQIDTLIMTTKFFIILEIKNYTGHLYFDDKFGQLIRSTPDKKDFFEDPIQQVKRQKYHLNQILIKYNFPQIPIEPLVVISNKNSHVDCSTDYKEALTLLIKSHKLHHKFNEFTRKHNKVLLTIKEMKKIHKQLNKLNVPYDTDILNHFEIKRGEIIVGVLCLDCNNKMERKRAGWICIKCSNYSRDAHVAALKDYGLLISNQITNKQCKEYLNLSSSDQAYYLLTSLNLPYTGTSRRTRTYHLDSLIT